MSVKKRENKIKILNLTIDVFDELPLNPKNKL